MKRADASPMARCDCGSCPVRPSTGESGELVCLKCRKPYLVFWRCENCGYMFQKDDRCLQCGLEGTFRLTDEAKRVYGRHVATIGHQP